MWPVDVFRTWSEIAWCTPSCGPKLITESLFGIPRPASARHIDLPLPAGLCLWWSSLLSPCFRDTTVTHRDMQIGRAAVLCEIGGWVSPSLCDCSRPRLVTHMG